MRSRVFVPGPAMPEDPATGSAAVGLGVALVATGLAAPEGATRYDIEQGVEMGRPSYLGGWPRRGGRQGCAPLLRLGSSRVDRRGDHRRTGLTRRAPTKSRRPDPPRRWSTHGCRPVVVAPVGTGGSR